MEECKHDKVYAAFVYTSMPPQRMWICRKCGEEGIDYELAAPTTFADEYSAIKEKFKKKD